MLGGGCTHITHIRDLFVDGDGIQSRCSVIHGRSLYNLRDSNRQELFEQFGGGTGIMRGRSLRWGEVQVCIKAIKLYQVLASGLV